MANFSITFHGRQAHVIDEKGRLILPSQFRDILRCSRTPDKVFLGCYPGTKFVSVYPCERWDELSLSWKDERRFPNTAILQEGQRLFFSNSEQVTVDRTGRVTIPAQFRNRASLKDEVAVIGVGEKMEIWNPADLDAHELEISKVWGQETFLYGSRPQDSALEEVRLPQF
ncbi:MAG: hypothetical protein LBU69_05490 [Deltaproteobacteria bacterium]|jgi:MraZ protein|nr:hypothetical protein [Deltaproteobacteria bacterium]